ncbi:TetR/AcrR family transcriptional regulator [Sutcliffiella halmapala]|uniref:TetR/AcrR family transcriptional regulator n=1 Tax=Sutcliffiella halmapala TaxID=79882 RepID=UPI0009949A85|nr:TetR/AcrR family transcriptional regulator [Sutcliffiella halmapala]
MDGFQRRREKKKEDILEAATNLFMADGIQNVSISEIAKEANVSQVTIYNYFESKQNLILEVFNYYIDKSVRDFEEIIHDTIPFPDKIKQIIFRKKETAQQINEEFYEYIMQDFSAAGNYMENKYLEKALPHFTDFFQQGKEQGYINPNLSMEAILFYIQMISHYFQKKDFHADVLPLTDELTNIFFYGIVGKRDE